MQQKTNVAFVVRVCLVAALGGLLFGYDSAVISGAIGFLVERFQLTPAMKGWATSSALLGCVIGVSVAGIASDYAGRKKTLILSGIVFLASSVGTGVAWSFASFIIFRILTGIGIGVASMASPMYIAEISPARIRGRMVSVNQLAIVSGIVVVYFVNYLIARGAEPAWNATMGWRWMFVSGALPSLLFLLLLLTVPESPRWLAENGHLDRSRNILERVEGAVFAERELRAIEETMLSESRTHVSLFAPQMLRILVLGISLAVLQQVTGINVIIYYGPEIFKQLGFQVDVALLDTVLVGAVSFVFTLVAIWTVDLLGRKPLMIAGTVGMGLFLLEIGATFQLRLVSGWVVVLILGYIACFAASVGPVTWVILAEMFPNRIRGRAMAVATFMLWVANAVVSQTFPMLNDSKWLNAHFNHGFTFYMYAAFCVVLVGVVWLAVPETKGRSLEEIERHWALLPDASPEVG